MIIINPLGVCPDLRRNLIMATQLSQTNNITVTPIHPVIGAEVTGVDLSQVLDATTVEEIRNAWHDHGVLLFRGQEITGDEQLRFASNFGPIAERHKPKSGRKCYPSR